ncbi:amylosucrase [Meredithblackwellia eburnea MCA 4105]
MPLTVSQQCRAVLAYVKDQLLLPNSGVREALSDKVFTDRLDNNFVTLYGIFADELYGYRNDCLDQLVALIRVAALTWLQRPQELRDRDKWCELNPTWFQSNKMLGGVCYVDQYANNLEGIRAKIPYFKELGLTYLHLMPLFKCPEKNSDGGYAVSNYREVDPKLGDLEALKSLATELRRAGISLVLDFIFNHTSNEHEWAQKALARDSEKEAFYWIFPDRQVPSAFERTTREIFPDDHSGSFVQLPDGRWIWATFYHFQWDLNYSNPSVFSAMLGEMLFLANCGVSIFRFDAVAFIWKSMGTTCESLPEAHKIIRAFNSMCRIACPSVIFKSEAIVHPDEVVQYIDTYECQLSYNPLQMALIWEGMATRDASMLAQALERRHNIARGCSWVNYCRSHDDIGWTFSDDDALELGKKGNEHRRFLNSFFVNRWPGSFARGVPFQDNPRTGDCRISGTMASLAGLESGEWGAVERILLAHSIIMSTGGIPLLYLGDEVGQLNDYTYVNDPSKADDSRWVNRPPYPEERYKQRDDLDTLPGQIYNGIRHQIEVRKNTDEFYGGRLWGFRTHNPAVLGYQRPGTDSTVLCLANFSDHPSWVGAEVFQHMPRIVHNLVTDSSVDLEFGIHLKSHQYAWLRYKT